MQVHYASRDAFSTKFIVIIFFCWKCFGTKESKCISPKVLTKEQFNSHCIFIIYLLFYKNDFRCFNGKNRFFLLTFMFADRDFGFLPLHKKANKVLQRWRVLAFYRITLCFNSAVHSCCVGRRIRASLKQLLN